MDLARRQRLATARARRLRREMTEAERILWWHLLQRGLGAKWRRQEPIGRYIVDFVSYWHRLIIELDGSQHADNEYDRERDRWLRDQGFRVLRFWNEEVFEGVHDVLGTILGVMEGSIPDWEGHI